MSALALETLDVMQKIRTTSHPEERTPHQLDRESDAVRQRQPGEQPPRVAPGDTPHQRHGTAGVHTCHPRAASYSTYSKTASREE